MLERANTLRGYQLHCRDGAIGTVKDFYFDDHHWGVRYLVADTAGWLAGRQVLISPYALKTVSSAEHSIALALTKKQLEDSPSLNTDKPVSRQYEESYYGFYGWPMYWNGPLLWGAYPDIVREPEHWQNTRPDGTGWDPHLRSTSDVTGHHIQAADGEIGHVEDFIIDDHSWAIRYLVIDTRNWWPGKKVLVSPKWIERVSWSESKVVVSLSREAVKQSPEYVEGLPLTREYETRLHQHYDRRGYWVDDPAATSHGR